MLEYAKKEVAECAMAASKPTIINDEQSSSVLSKSKEEVKDVDFLLVSSSHSMMSIGDLGIPITRTNMRLLTTTRHEEKEELDVNN